MVSVVNKDIRVGLFNINWVNESYVSMLAEEKYSGDKHYNFDLSTDAENVRVLFTEFATRIETSINGGLFHKLEQHLEDLVDGYAEMFYIENVEESEEEVNEEEIDLEKPLEHYEMEESESD